MEKRVLIYWLLLLLAGIAGAIILFLITTAPAETIVPQLEHVPQKIAPPQVEADVIYNSCIQKGTAFVELISAIASKDANTCPPYFEPMTVACNAAIGISTACDNEKGFSKDSCLAILNKDVTECNGWDICVALAGGIDACAQSVDVESCKALASSNTNYFKDTTACDRLRQQLSK